MLGKPTANCRMRINTCKWQYLIACSSHTPYHNSSPFHKSTCSTALCTALPLRNQSYMSSQTYACTLPKYYVRPNTCAQISLSSYPHCYTLLLILDLHHTSLLLYDTTQVALLHIKLLLHYCCPLKPAKHQITWYQCLLLLVCSVTSSNKARIDRLKPAYCTHRVIHCATLYSLTAAVTHITTVFAVWHTI
jgi:hypothetical protein